MKVALLVEKEFQDMEVMYPYYRMQEAGHEATVLGLDAIAYKGKFGYPIKADDSVKDRSADEFDAVIIPGGWAPDFMRRVDDFTGFVRKMNEQGKVIASICHGAWILASADVCKGKKLTCFYAIKDDVINAGGNYVDEEVVVDGNLITARKPEDLPAFCKAILAALG